MSGLTLYDKIWSRHVVKNYDDGDDLLYIDRHIVHEVSSPQAFAGLIAEHRGVRRPNAHIAVADHAVPTRLRSAIAPDNLAGRQISHLEANTKRFSVLYIPITDSRHGIVHVIGPEQDSRFPAAHLRAVTVIRARTARSALLRSGSGPGSANVSSRRKHCGSANRSGCA